ncbi:GNAT family N-acetyltransferase [Sutcliffiella deserti]|uniref:GNAT family N-acetyltransferase n=1 Tax=Sutcliffiella deserti TaxID=2875501 RepID=UPI001CC02DD6|nr:GNAT family N-acetyltransferase [Sutcliffiella deserti]
MVHLVKVKQEEEESLQHLIQFYIYEFTRFLEEITLENNGTYKPFDLKKYWEEPQYHAFFIKIEEELAGFALIEEGTAESPHSIEEFFVIRKYHGRGLGRIAAQKLFSMFEGKWKVVQIQNNYPAQAFWRKTIQEFTNNCYKEHYDEYRRSVQEFDTFTLNEEDASKGKNLSNRL